MTPEQEKEEFKRYLQQQQDMFGDRLYLEPTHEDTTSPLNESSTLSPDELQSFHDEIQNCQLCALGKTRTKFVFGAGNPHSRVVFVGEAPGEREDLLGEPFVGRAGKLLDKILEAIQTSR